MLLIFIFFCIIGVVLSLAFISIKSHMVSYEASVKLEYDGIDTYTTKSTFIVDVDDEYIIIPKGVETTLSMLPDWFHSIVVPHYLNIPEVAVLHAFFYKCPLGHTRKQIDDIYYHSLTSLDVPRLMAFRLWLGARLLLSNRFVKDGCK